MNKLGSLLVSALLIAALVSCSSVAFLFPPANRLTDNGTEPSPTPPPKKKKMSVWNCRVSNNAGRIMTVVDETKDVAESRARSSCERSYRNCTLLDCESVDED